MNRFAPLHVDEASSVYSDEYMDSVDDNVLALSYCMMLLSTIFCQGTPLEPSVVNEMIIYLLTLGKFGQVVVLLGSADKTSLCFGRVLKGIKKGCAR